MSQYKLFCDGAYSPLRNQMGVGVVFLKDDKPILEYSKMLIGGSNNRAELSALIIGLSFIKNPIPSLTIISDSAYCIGCAILGWKRSKNQDLWKLFDSQFNRVKELCSDINFEHVLGHQKNDDLNTIYNNKADKLARTSSQQL